MLKTISGGAYVPVAEFQVSADTVEYQSDVAFSKLGDGGFVAVWSDSRFGNGSVMRMQRFDLNGGKVGAEIILSAGGGASLAPTPSGGFLLTWTAQAPYPTSFEVRARFYDSSLNPLGPEFGVNTRTDGFQLSSGVTALAGGGYVVTWQQPEDQTFDHVRAQVLDSAGNRVGGEIIVTEDATGDKYDMGLTALAGGGFVAAWSGFEVSDEYGNLSRGLRAQIFDGAGNKVGPAFSLNSIIPGTQINATLAALPSGGFVAAWTDDGTRQSGTPANGNQGVWVQQFDSLGQKTGTAVRVGSGGTSVSGIPTIAVTATGFVVAWPESAALNAGQNVMRAQRFDFDGSKAGEEFVVGAASVTHVNTTSIVLDSGAILLGWTQHSPSTLTSDDVHAQLLYPATHGTEAADNHSGAAGRDFYFGHGGNDIISGGADDDGLSGGEGDDVLTGGTGNDVLDGGAGADHMTGGTGNDSYTVDQPGDVVVENAGEGNDTVETSLVDYAASAAIENLTGTLGAGATQTLRGNALDNVLIGGDADNVFHVGTGGHDAVRGNGGLDTLYIDWSDSTEGVTSELLYNPSSDRPGALYREGYARSVTYSRVETIYLTTGSGSDMLVAPSAFNGPVATHISSGAGDDLAYLNSTLDSFDGGSGIDGVYTTNVAETAGAFEWRVPSNLFVSPAGTPQLSNIEYFLYGVTGWGNDVIETGRIARPDSLYTGAGDDLVTFYNGRDRLDAGGGFDTLILDWRDSTAPVVIQLSYYPFEELYIGNAYSGDDREVTFSEVERLIVHSGSAADNLSGSDLADFLAGGGGDDSLFGGDGDDTIEGGAGNDRLRGGTGADTMRGGTGDDVYVVDNAGDLVEENSGEGADEVRTSLAAYSLFGTNLENLTATSDSAHDFRGNSANNAVTGGGGGDFLRLQDGGDDTAAGGLGNDVFLFGAALTSADQVNGGAGTDQIAIQGDYWGPKALTLGANVVAVENLAVLPGNEIRFGDPGTNFYDYNITALDSAVAAGVQLTVDANRLRAGEDFTFDGSAETDGSFFVYGGAGADLLTGGAKNDVFLFGAWDQFGSGDVVVGGSGIDQLALRGNYSLTFGAGQLVGIENIGLLSAHDTRFGALGSSYSYNLTMVDANVAAGVQMVVDGAKLRIAEFFRFDGSAELDGSFRVFGGLVDDIIIASRNNDFIQGNGGADSLTGGAGADIFRYLSTSDSTSSAMDRILDFASGSDKIDLSRIDANTLTAGDQAFSWIGPFAFTGSAGQLRADLDGSNWVVQGDTDGDGLADFVLMLSFDGQTPLSGSDFVL